MPKTDYIDYLCRPFCTYFKAGEKEEMTCRGALVAQALMERYQIRQETVAHLPKTVDTWEGHRGLLDEQVCALCDFKEKDCDFQSELPETENPEPCGGYIAVYLLLKHGLLDKQMLEDSK